MQITLKQIQYFLAAAETGQFSAAARKVHVTQTAVTAAIRELESTVGLALFHRHHASGVSLTVDGQKFLSHAHNIAAAVNAAMSEPGLMRQNVAGSVRLGATPSILGFYLVPAIARFRQAYPQIDLEVVELDGPALQRALGRGKIDVGVSWLESLERSGTLTTVSLTRSRRQLWLCANHPLLRRRGIRLADVRALPYVLYNQDETPLNTRLFWNRMGQKPDIRYRVTSIEALRSLVAQGLAVTILSDVAYRPFSSEGLRIETRPLLDELPAIEIGVAWHPKRGRSAPGEALRAFLQLTFGGPGSGVKVV
jgi:DNA-binding transcriptional LysR family regulator